MNEIIIRDYQDRDAPNVGRLIADTYATYNLDFLTPKARGPFLGPFQHAHSSEPAHQEAIAQVIRSEMVFVAEVDGEIVGVLRGRKERLGSLFVSGDHHRLGIGRRLVEHFGFQVCVSGMDLQECLAQAALKVGHTYELFAYVPEAERTEALSLALVDRIDHVLPAGPKPVRDLGCGRARLFEEGADRRLVLIGAVGSRACFHLLGLPRRYS